MSNLRLIKVFTTKGGKTKFQENGDGTVTVIRPGRDNETRNIEADIFTNWQSLRPLVQEFYDLSNLQATENVNKATLVHDEAELPESDFTLFLRPTKTKSGSSYDSMSYKDLRANLTDVDKDAIEDQTGKNWTRCSTQDLRDYFNNKSTDSTTVEDTNVVVEEVNAIDAGQNNTSRLAAVKSILTEIRQNTESEEVEERLDLVEDELDGLGDAIEAEDSPEAVAQKQADEQETEDLEDEFASFNDGF